MKVKYLVVHCADTPDDREVTASGIHDWHKARGWDGIGYHWVFGRGGDIIVVLVNICERENITISECLAKAWS